MVGDQLIDISPTASAWAGDPFHTMAGGPDAGAGFGATGAGIVAVDVSIGAGAGGEEETIGVAGAPFDGVLPLGATICSTERITMTPSHNTARSARAAIQIDVDWAACPLPF